MRSRRLGAAIAAKPLDVRILRNQPQDIGPDGMGLRRGGRAVRGLSPSLEAGISTVPEFWKKRRADYATAG